MRSATERLASSDGERLSDESRDLAETRHFMKKACDGWLGTRHE